MTVWLLYLAILVPSGGERHDPSDATAHVDRWIAECFAPAQTVAYSNPPFSFVYGGRPSTEMLPGWKRECRVSQFDAVRTNYCVTYRDSESGLIVSCNAVRYGDFPTVEWTVRFENTGADDTPILSDIRAVDVVWERLAAEEFLLHHHLGSPCTPEDYRPMQTPLTPGMEKRIAAAGGRPTNSDLPYFNLEWDQGGVIFVVGWPGQWAASFTRDSERCLTVRAGQEVTRLKLHPGEQVRTPLVVLQFWRGDLAQAQNLWRRWMIAHNVPRPGGKPFTTHYASTSGNLSDAAREVRLLEDWDRHGIQLDYWCMDANWYPTGGKWFHTGTWEPDPRRFPRGLREVSDAARARGVKTIVWFEPERVWPGTWLWEKHPQWLLACPVENQQTPELGRFANRLLNLGNAEARQWLVEHVDRMITEERIDVYRQDFNINPLAYWRANDAADRQGITEHNYVIGYLAWWDELLRRHPDIWIDTCASGGRRNDLETLRRAVPLLRSDYFSTPEAQQCQTLGLSLWVPFYGSGCGLADDYLVRSSICPLWRIGIGRPMNDAEAARVRRHVEHFRQIEPCLAGDFYALTPYSLAKDVWCAWQFDRPDLGQGVVQAFRRSECPTETIPLRLRGLSSDGTYVVTDLDSSVASTATGSDLMGRGLTISTQARPRALLFTYRRRP